MKRTMRRRAIAGLIVVVGMQSAAAADTELLDLYDHLSRDERSPPGATTRAVAPAPELQAAHTLTVQVEDVRNDHGVVRVLLFDDAQAYAALDANALAGYAEVPAVRGSVAVSVPVASNGPFALFVFHDENADSKLNMQGARPLEGYVYSGAVGPYAPPAFARAAVVTDGSHVRLFYLPADSGASGAHTPWQPRHGFDSRLP